MRESSMLVLLAMLVVVGGVGYLSHKVFKMDEDNVIEEFAEDFIEEKTGLDVDLSPGSPETKK